jgi:conjugative transfer signal peptidase TraF
MRVDPARRRGQIVVLAMLVGLLAVLAMSTTTRTPRLIYNASVSAPIGFYRVENRPPARGDIAVIRPSRTLETLLVTHSLLPPGVPLLKRIVAIRDDRVCRSGGVVFVNDEAVAEALEQDRQGRPLPFWEGCLKLLEGQFFLVQPHPESFDSRYFGPVSQCAVVGVAHPLWTWNPAE